MIRVVIIGPNGKMGRAMVKAAHKHADVRLAGTVGPRGRPYIGSDVGLLVGLGSALGTPVVDDIEAVVNACDVVMECTRPAVSMQMLEACLVHRKAFVTGTTGFSDTQRQSLRDAGGRIAVLPASNTSRVVHLLFQLIKTATRAMGRTADIDVVDLHASTKPDAPSGTAREIGAMVAAELGNGSTPMDAYGQDRKGARPPGRIQFSSIRSGGIPSSHQIIFGFENERLELVHHVYNMDAFADGMLAAALFIAGRPRGCYRIEEVFEPGMPGPIGR